MAKKEQRQPQAAQPNLYDLNQVIIEDVTPEDIGFTRVGKKNVDTLRGIVRQLKVGQKFSVPKNYEGALARIRKEEEFEAWKLKFKVTPDKKFVKCIRIV